MGKLIRRYRRQASSHKSQLPQWISTGAPVSVEDFT
jgi:hypothetical protein